MPVRPILNVLEPAGERYLWRSAGAVTEETWDEALRVAHDLLATARSRRRPQAIGMSAPQIGSDLRIIAVLHAGVWRALVNPTLTIPPGTPVLASFETCFSALEAGQKRCARSASVIVSYQDLKRRPRREPAHGRLATVYQHEVEHLSGIVLGCSSYDELAGPRSGPPGPGPVL